VITTQREGRKKGKNFTQACKVFQHSFGLNRKVREGEEKNREDRQRVPLSSFQPNWATYKSK
jgi:hypothetical protein